MNFSVGIGPLLISMLTPRHFIAGQSRIATAGHSSSPTLFPVVIPSGPDGPRRDSEGSAFVVSSVPPPDAPLFRASFTLFFCASAKLPRSATLTKRAPPPAPPSSASVIPRSNRDEESAFVVSLAPPAAPPLFLFSLTLSVSLVIPRPVAEVANGAEEPAFS